MKNGFEIQITEAEFKGKPVGEQNWILFQGVTFISKSVSTIDEEGCKFAKKKHRKNIIELISGIAGGVTFALGLIYIIYQMVHK